MAKKIYGYDVYYRLKTMSSVLVAAHNKEEARRIAEQTLEDMPRGELVSRFLAAVDFEPEFQIGFIEKVDEMDESDLQGPSFEDLYGAHGEYEDDYGIQKRHGSD